MIRDKHLFEHLKQRHKLVATGKTNKHRRQEDKVRVKEGFKDLG